MIRNLCLLMCVLLSKIHVCAQLYSIATASASAIIISPVGTVNSGSILAGRFYPRRTTATAELNSNLMSREVNIGLDNEPGIPSFHVLAGDTNYSISLAYDPLIINQGAMNETIRIKTINVIPVHEKKMEQGGSDQFLIDAKLLISAFQMPGYYSSPKPYAVTINFN